MHEEIVYERGRQAKFPVAQIPEWVLTECRREAGFPVAQIPEWVLTECRREAWLYARISLLVEETGCASVTELATSSRVTTRTVQAALGKLKGAGAVAVLPSERGKPPRYIPLTVRPTGAQS